MAEKADLYELEGTGKNDLTAESRYLTKCERKVIKVIWESEELLTIREIAARVNEKFECGWHLQTVSSFLGHLVRKGYLSMTRSGRAFIYTPLVSEEEDRTKQFTQMLDFWCDGQADEFLKSLLKDRTLTEEEKMNMRKIINDLD